MNLLISAYLAGIVALAQSGGCSAWAAQAHFRDPCVSKTPAPGGGADLPCKYIGNSFSGKFHRPSCPFARAMSRQHKIFFCMRAEAVEAGQSPCRYCLPPDWKRVHAKLLTAR